MDPTIAKAQQGDQPNTAHAFPPGQGLNAPLVANAVLPSQAYVIQQPGELVDVLPPPKPDVENSFNYGLCDRCCTCDATCWMGWCCACFPVAQMLEKLKLAGKPQCLNFKTFLIFWLLLFIVGVIIAAFSDGGCPNLSYILLVVMLVIIRGAVRERYAIPGNCCCDCLASWFCAPCTITQLAGQLWSNPDKDPGCLCDESPASTV